MEGVWCEGGVWCDGGSVVGRGVWCVGVWWGEWCDVREGCGVK